MPTTNAAIRIQGVTKTFGSKTAVSKLDLEVPTGSVCGFLGPNGAGKTTTIRMVMSIFGPDSGSIEVLGRKSAIESKDRIGYLPEERGVYRKMRVGDFIRYMATLKGVESQGLTEKIDAWLERLELPGVRKKKCEELSKGMQQKVQYLAAVIHEPELIILDEPFSGLDPVNVRLIRGLIDELRREGKTIIFSTHVLASAEALCDRIFMINKGQKVLDGSIGAIREKFNPRTIIVEPLESANGVFDRVESTPGVHSATHAGDDGWIEAHVNDGADPQAVMQSLMGIAPMRRVELRRASLEDIFIAMVDPEDASEDSLRAALSAGGGAPAPHKEAATHA
ncbi:MAG: ATP-binding cassette domain-containing protein [Phycisphaeraceae bacterium]|nr:ATP-binding cassette domain-containing protein [Phycisphaeraceae bacterium]MCB9847777.1 ATP-binding cassette domain-containing protein [Phycisphaeraceae bacterium]